MKALALLIPLLLAVLMGYAIGRWGAVSRLSTRNERKELKQATDLIVDLSNLASEHDALGEPGATRALHLINTYRKALS